MPLLFGLMNAVVPLQIGARDVSFPFLNARTHKIVPRPQELNPDKHGLKSADDEEKSPGDHILWVRSSLMKL
jgi:hypothetical protein